MPPRWLLLLPVVLAIVAVRSDHILAKMGVPVSCALIVLWLRRELLGSRPELFWLVAALCLSAVGDWFLSHRRGHETYFVTGIGFFFLANVGYLAFAWCQGQIHRPVLGALLVVFLPYYLFLLRPSLTDPMLSVAVLFYLLISCLMLSAAAGMRLPASLKAPYVVGISLIVVSDTIISLREWLGYAGLAWLILPTYYLAHLCVSWTVLTRH